ncbi:hypothetical protein QIS74_08157 [Colletotrichum tabaci]|uniref:RelA/SpoT domain-containing protein n=1 Tax=Colletotrichum tabaci TaxID=1209068 RepID=A0AAV9T758_9PEZI
MHESTSRGYRATHLVVRHTNLDFDPHAKDDPEVNIEIQIGTIVMHAWSDIEHEILYKPSGAEEPTEDVVSTLGLINSTVTLGEEALRQLESVSSRQATRQAEDHTKKAFNYDHMVPWLDKYFMDRETLLPPKHEWRSMPHLFEILEATSEHTYGRVEELLDDMVPGPGDMGKLPALILQHLGKGTYPFKNPENLGQPHLATTWNSRYWATCLVNTLNLATYMNESAAMYSVMLAESCRDQSLHDRRPTLAEFLDILHPSKPMHRPSRESEMIQFCMRLLALNSGYVARPRFTKAEEENLLSWGEQAMVFVPSLLGRLTLDSDHVHYRVTLCALGEEIPVKGSHGLYFIPSWAVDDGRTWKPTMRDPGDGWAITQSCFVHSTPIDFELDVLGVDLYAEHLHRVLEVGNRATVEVIQLM